MDYQPSQDLNLQEAMECCRPGCDDQSDPMLAPLAAGLSASAELRERFARQQKLDAALAAAIRDVPVRAGLAERLMAALGTAGTRARSAQALPAAPVAQAMPAAVLPARPRLDRFYPAWARGAWVYAATMAAAALLMIVVGVLHEGRKQTYPVGTVLEKAVNFFFNADTPGSGVAMDQQQPPADYPASSLLRPLPGTSWREVSGLLEPGTVAYAYDMTSAQGTHATLYVIRTTKFSVPDISSGPPPQPGHDTGGCCAAAWQEGKLLYVLVVAGDSNSYLEFLQSAPGQIT